MQWTFFPEISPSKKRTLNFQILSKFFVCDFFEIFGLNFRWVLLEDLKYYVPGSFFKVLLPENLGYRVWGRIIFQDNFSLWNDFIFTRKNSLKSPIPFWRMCLEENVHPTETIVWWLVVTMTWPSTITWKTATKIITKLAVHSLKTFWSFVKMTEFALTGKKPVSLFKSHCLKCYFQLL